MLAMVSSIVRLLYDLLQQGLVYKKWIQAFYMITSTEESHESGAIFFVMSQVVISLTHMCMYNQGEVLLNTITTKQERER